MTGFGDATKLRQAEKRAGHLYPRSKPFRSVYRAGAKARLDGLAPSSCPYRRDPHKTWRNSYRRVWQLGYESVRA